MKEELDDLRKEREDARNRAQVAAVEEQKEANIRPEFVEGVLIRYTVTSE